MQNINWSKNLISTIKSASGERCSILNVLFSIKWKQKSPINWILHNEPLKSNTKIWIKKRAKEPELVKYFDAQFSKKNFKLTKRIDIKKTKGYDFDNLVSKTFSSFCSNIISLEKNYIFSIINSCIPVTYSLSENTFSHKDILLSVEKIKLKSSFETIKILAPKNQQWIEDYNWQENIECRFYSGDKIYIFGDNKDIGFFQDDGVKSFNVWDDPIYLKMGWKYSYSSWIGIYEDAPIEIISCQYPK